MPVFEELIQAILVGNPPPGGALAAERELARIHGVGRPAVREALRRLEALGLVESRHGSGTVVRAWQQDATLDLLPHYMAAGAPGADIPRLLTELLRLRVFPCCEVVRLAACYAPLPAFERAHAMVDDAARLRKDPAAFALKDLDLFRHLAGSVAIPPALWLLNSALPAFRMVIDRFGDMVKPPADYRARMHEVLDTASRRQATNAVKQLTEYFQNHDRLVLKKLGITEAT
jgi:DNA-binding FadR family transcriptional regulator